MALSNPTYKAIKWLSRYIGFCIVSKIYVWDIYEKLELLDKTFQSSLHTIVLLAVLKSLITEPGSDDF